MHKRFKPGDMVRYVGPDTLCYGSRAKRDQYCEIHPGSVLEFVEYHPITTALTDNSYVSIKVPGDNYARYIRYGLIKPAAKKCMFMEV